MNSIPSSRARCLVGRQNWYYVNTDIFSNALPFQMLYFCFCKCVTFSNALLLFCSNAVLLFKRFIFQTLYFSGEKGTRFPKSQNEERERVSFFSFLATQKFQFEFSISSNWLNIIFWPTKSISGNGNLQKKALQIPSIWKNKAFEKNKSKACEKVKHLKKTKVKHLKK